MESKHIVKVISIDSVTHDVIKIVTDKPSNYEFNPGQATEVAINKPGWKSEKRPFTFTCLPTSNYLEFIIKTYPEKKGVTNELMQLKTEDELIIHQSFGAIAYRGEGLFIAGGAGITPFIAIFRQLNATNSIANNKLIFANKTIHDIILENEWKSMLGDQFIPIISEENLTGYLNGVITESVIRDFISDINKPVYVCGPPAMMEAVSNALNKIGVKASEVVTEVF